MDEERGEWRDDEEAGGGGGEDRARHIDVYWAELSFGIDNGEIRLSK